MLILYVLCLFSHLMINLHKSLSLCFLYIENFRIKAKNSHFLLNWRLLFIVQQELTEE